MSATAIAGRRRRTSRKSAGPQRKSGRSQPRLAPEARRDLWHRRRPLWAGTLSVLGFLAIWQLIGRLHLVDTFFLATPTEIWRTLADLFSSGEIWNDLWVSGQELFFTASDSPWSSEFFSG